MAAKQQSIPTPALILGLAGLIPFVSAALVIWLQPMLDAWLPVWVVQERSILTLATFSLGAYGAVILSFLGGVRWGNLLHDAEGLGRWLPLTLSVVPSLIAWPALLLAPIPQLALLCVGFTLQYGFDVAAARRGEVPEWFLRLRLILSSGAILSLLAGLLGNAF
ncbi:MAG: DUF3429 domain-containing protein [Granulosicoccus sp.]